MSLVDLGKLSFSTWNVNGLGHPIKRKKVVASLKRNKLDIVFLQETHLAMQEAEKLGRAFGDYMFCSEGSSNNKGVIILIKKHLQFRCIKQMKDKSGRVIMVWAEILGQNLLLANIYAPNIDDQIFFYRFGSEVASCCEL